MKTDILAGIVTTILIVFYTITFAQSPYTFETDLVMLAIPSDSGAYFDADLVNIGDSRNNYIVTKQDNMPDSWIAYLCIDSLCLPGDSGQVILEPGSSSRISVELYPYAAPGDGEVTVTVRPTSNPDDLKTITFRAVTGYSVLLLADGDEENEYRSYYEDALNVAEVEFNYWDKKFSNFRYTDLLNFQHILSYTGNRTNGLFSDEEIQALTDFLGSGGNLFLTGQGAASSLQQTAFLNDYLGLYFVDTYDADPAVDGANNDPIGDGLSFFITGGDGANNQVEPDQVEADYESYISFIYTDGAVAGVHKTTENYRTLFLSFGLEAVDNEADRNVIIERTFNWFFETTSTYDNNPEILPNSLALMSYPNPFNASTVISYELPNDNNIVISIYDLLGRKVAILYDGHHPAGEYSLTWNPADIPSGVYFARLEAGYRIESIKMVLIK
ncbi:MAG: T9SS type A sorting domain-containing protein [candidate division Zixibacteria bacterium]